MKTQQQSDITNHLLVLNDKPEEELTPLEASIVYLYRKGGYMEDAIKAADKLEKYVAVAKSSKSLMDTFDEFGNFNYSSEYIDALIDALNELEKL